MSAAVGVLAFIVVVAWYDVRPTIQKKRIREAVIVITIYLLVLLQIGCALLDIAAFNPIEAYAALFAPISEYLFGFFSEGM